MTTKQLALYSIVLGLVNIVSVFFNQAWYLILSFVVLGGGPILYGLLMMGKDTPEAKRTIAWVDIIFGLSILSLAASSFYGQTNLPFIQYVTSLGLIGLGCFALFQVISQDNIDIIP